MSQKIIQPSTSDQQFQGKSDGYEYTVGPKQAITSEASSTYVHSRIYSESLLFKKQEVSLSAMAFLFQEMISQLHRTCKSTSDFETKLSDYGHNIGIRLLELLNFRASVSPSSLPRASTFLSQNDSSSNASNTSGIMSNSNTATSSSANERLQEKQAESLSNYITKMRRRDLKILDILQFIHGTLWSYLFNHVSDDLVKSSERDNEYMIVDNFPNLTQFIPGENVSCEYFVCGIVKGFLFNAGFPCDVTAHRMPQSGYSHRTVYLIQFDRQVLEREGLRFS
ncbi:trs31p [Saccharomyces arboricola H-6]|uniref:Trafficking protein particle complex subunit n=1 Tax=Saccharomyces arboricola (strain H-6 / AS 2.3317 / CBS 10644) TaxID=1160507 RepID=J8LJF6_SACAR|nr:trs31p [Saccharomyces arboricola H-6]